MKWFSLILLILILGRHSVFAEEGSFFVVKDVSINCVTGEMCHFFKKNKETLKRAFNGEEEFYELMNIFYSKEGFSSFRYELKPVNGGFNLSLDIKTKERISLVDFEIAKDHVKESDLRSVIDLREETYLEVSKLGQDKNKIKRKLSLLGYPSASVSHRLHNPEGEDGIEVYFYVDEGNPLIIQDVKKKCKSSTAKEMVSKYFQNFSGKVFNKEEVIQETKDLASELQNQGFYLSNVQFSAREVKGGVNLEVTCGNTERVVLSLDDQNKFFEKKDVYSFLREYLKTTQRNFSENDLRRVVEDLYIKRGFNDPQVEIESKVFSSDKERIIYATVIIKKTERLKVESVGFQGVSHFTEKELIDFFYNEGSDLAKSNYIDKDFYETFNQKLANKYIEDGFVNVSVKHYVGIAGRQKRTLLFIVNEGSRAIIKKVQVRELGQEKNNQELVALLGVKNGDPFNPLIFDSKLQKLLSYLKDEGFYFSEIVNASDNNIVEYSNGNREVSIDIIIKRGKKARVRDVVAYGVKKTKSSVIRRKLHYAYGALLTPALLKNVHSDIASLGIFRSYNVLFIGKHSQTGDVDLIIEVEEKDYGAFELAPGYRTDLGMKVSARLSRSNLLGRNQTVALSAQSNYRLDMRDIEEARTGEKFLEYFGKINYIYPDFLKTYWDYYNSVSASRKRFYSFDADIFRISNTMRKEISRNLSFSLTHQLENIRQFNAIPKANGIDDNGTFRIGGLTPSFILDLRDNPVIPRKGAHIQLSYELAKPSFGSQDKNDLKIDFYKMILRNKFYVPVTSDLHIASSLSLGVQKNLADDQVLDSNGELTTTGFIPSIKVFRLSGIDTVRGFSEGEINLINNSTDIKDVAIRDKAYMTNFKLEPRYMFTDSVMLGVFFDAGSVQKDSFKPFEVRSSAGLSFKYVTPVGTLDFDYGFKLERRTKPDGSRESPGRLHVSIGFF